VRLSVFYDYTCSYSYRFWRWIDACAGPLGLDVEWRTFSLREINREPGVPSLFEDAHGSSVSVLALALAHAARRADFDRYHRDVFHAMHEEHLKVSAEDLLDIASKAGVERDAFERERARWTGSAARDHASGVAEHGVFGTPTVVMNGSAIFVRFAEIPSETGSLFETLERVCVGYPEIIEMKRPARPSP
jgi:2-hydroxychromene-2-carboxylate isomerase